MSRWGPLVMGLRLPADFPWTLHESYNYRVLGKAGTGVTEEWKREWIGSWLAVLFRFYACDAYGKRFTRSIARHTSAPGDLYRYQQDHDLFGFFTSGLATLDSLYYTLFAVGHLLDPLDFPFTTESDYRKANLDQTVTAYKRKFRSESLTSVMSAACSSPEYKEWAQFRNILAHRVTPGRMLYASLGPPTPPNELMIAGRRIPIDANMTTSRRAWLAGTVTSILSQVDGPFGATYL